MEVSNHVFVLFFTLLNFMLPLKISAYQYKATISDNEVIQKCEGADKDNFIDKYLDLSDMKYEFDDDEFTVNGVLKVKKDFPSMEIYEFKVILFQKKNGQWVQTVFAVQRMNFCGSILDPAEVWYDGFHRFEKELKPCPPKGGTKFVFDNFKSSSVFNADSRDIAGKYKIVAIMVGNRKTRMCFQFTCDVTLVGE